MHCFAGGFSAYSIQWDDLHSFFFLLAGVPSAALWHFAYLGIVVMQILLLNIFLLLFLLILCLQFLLPMLLYVLLLFGCACFRRIHAVMSLTVLLLLPRVASMLR